MKLSHHVMAITYAMFNILFYFASFTLFVISAPSISVRGMLDADELSNMGLGEQAMLQISNMFNGSVFPSGYPRLEILSSLFLFVSVGIVVKLACFYYRREIKYVIGPHAPYKCFSVAAFFIVLLGSLSFWVPITAVVYVLGMSLVWYIGSRMAKSTQYKFQFKQSNGHIPQATSCFIAPLLVVLFATFSNGFNPFDLASGATNHARLHSAFNPAQSSLTDACLQEEVTRIPAANPLKLGLVTEPCYYNRYALEGKTLSYADKFYLLSLDGNYLDIVNLKTVFLNGGDVSDAVRVQYYLDSNEAMASQLKRIKSYPHLDNRFAIDPQVYQLLQLIVMREQGYVDEIKIRVTRDGYDKTMAYIERLKSLDFNRRPSANIYSDFYDYEPVPEIDAFISLERMKELKERKLRIDAEMGFNQI